MPSHTNPNRICPQCGGPKDWPAKTCWDCYKRNGRGPVIHREDGSTLLPLPHGEYTVIDTDDYERVAPYSWHRMGNGYVLAVIPDRGSGAQVLLHRFITNAKTGTYVDHIDHDVLHNRKINLAVGSQAENMHNRAKRGDDRYRGVTIRKDTGRYRASIAKNHKQYTLGCFDTAEEAALAYNEAAIRLYGDRAVLNDVNSTAHLVDEAYQATPGVDAAPQVKL